MKQIVSILFVAVLLFMSSCSQQQLQVSVSNPTDMIRANELVKVSLIDSNLDKMQLVVKDQASDEEIQSQLLDTNGDNEIDGIAFIVQLDAKEQKVFTISPGNGKANDNNVKTFARFVPERTDDFAWENDRVAFRTYGPEAQRIAEAGEKGGTLSSGIDCWLKKVDYSIIDKWYLGNINEPGYYHIDHGEGLDNYHVGPSRGCGGTGVMFDGKLIAAKNFTDYKIGNKGPLVTEFTLNYAPYEVGSSPVKETKHVSIHLGTNFTKYIIEVEGTDTLTVGLTLHDQLGEVTQNATWINYHTSHTGEELSSAIVAHPKYMVGTSHIKSDVKDESHALMHLKVIEGKVEFYAGFTWSGSKQYTQNQWEQYLNDFASGLAQPLMVFVNE
ncbi:DUF4861 family protein [Carboxylicivirga sp. M1479]|uniref:DUF4861 family protein n=1 Tax=Carboxylicivirga sp. M1479 TaxID=2594476 RepID=UPI0011778D23|nr:DUF4861 family protein [Carboxylicivirga sp. M1479]TRX70625.1 DUF4861 domain-containing protein [Carboxylicivirga sp. M1479]